MESIKRRRSFYEKYAPSGSFLAPAGFGEGLQPSDAKSLIREVSLFNFRCQLSALDQVADKTRPKPSPMLSQADLETALAHHCRTRGRLIESVFNMSDRFTHSPVPFTLHSMETNTGLAAEHWAERQKSVHALWKLMDSWPGTKPDFWYRGEDDNLVNMPGPGAQWERCVAEFYVQAFYNYYGYPPVLPCRI
ncbi:hypothetical protein D9758_000430 [Tetrapyrgos nigripes]|uniref:Uncharacterized protein n=1 Tax=Tetrapyrgos nigripes TaxID=182062 RepID=A0A8H5LZF3_9AGAR|nr:hypothetical protein D9758_000430 [Tetrapyrgos nigripes]